MSVTAIAINCTLKRDAAQVSSTDSMIQVLQKSFSEHDVHLSETIRIAAHNVLPGVTSDEGDGDDWPAIREKILAHDILIFGTPIWLGHPSSLARRVLERMDAFLGETDEQGRMPSYGKIAVVAIVGNEDGAHASSAQLYQGLNDVGWTIPAGAACYWVGEAMGSTDFNELVQVPEKVTTTAKMVASNASHLAKTLKGAPYPGS